jgi:predicted PurR-regulated permease PerM
MIITTTIVGHLLRALRRSLSRVFLLFLISGLIAVIISEIVDIVITGALPNIYANGVALALGIGVGYIAGLMTLVWEVFRDLIRSFEELEKDFVKELTAGPALVEKVIEQVERRI